MSINILASILSCPVLSERGKGWHEEVAKAMAIDTSMRRTSIGEPLAFQCGPGFESKVTKILLKLLEKVSKKIIDIHIGAVRISS